MILSDLSSIDRAINIQRLNQKLVDVLSQTGYELIQYARKHDIELPYKIAPLLEQAQKYIKELKSPTSINKKCSVCKTFNPSNADFCCYCGSSLIIIHVSPDVLHGKRGDSNHPKSDNTGELFYLFYDTSFK